MAGEIIYETKARLSGVEQGLGDMLRVRKVQVTSEEVRVEGQPPILLSSVSGLETVTEHPDEGAAPFVVLTHEDGCTPAFLRFHSGSRLRLPWLEVRWCKKLSSAINHASAMLPVPVADLLRQPGMYSKDLGPASALSKKMVSLGPADPSEVREHADRAVAATRSASCYRSRLVGIDLIHRVAQEGDFVWELEFVKPDRYHVFQTSWMDGIGAVYDRWITIGDDHYQDVGLWLKAPRLSDYEGELRLNDFARVEKYLEVMGTADPITAVMYCGDDGKILLLEYGHAAAVALKGLLKDQTQGIEDSHVEVWVDLETYLIAKAVLSTGVRGPDGSVHRYVWQQIFGAYGANVRIYVPPVQLEPVEQGVG